MQLNSTAFFKEFFLRVMIFKTILTAF